MNRIYDALTKIPRRQLIDEIVSAQKNGGMRCIHFLYYASADMNGLFGSLDSSYARELLAADYLLPDGIAIRLLHFSASRPELQGWKILFQYQKYSKLAIENKNGTDFVPELIESLPKDGRIVMYGTTPEGIVAAVNHAKMKFRMRVSGTHGYDELDMKELSGTDPVLLLIGRGSPRQELWVQNNRHFLENRPNLIVVTVGGLFDFWAGIESRAPVWMRGMGLEWLYRLVNEPRKNFRKSMVSFKFFYRILFSNR